MVGRWSSAGTCYKNSDPRPESQTERATETKSQQRSVGGGVRRCNSHIKRGTITQVYFGVYPRAGFIFLVAELVKSDYLVKYGVAAPIRAHWNFRSVAYITFFGRPARNEKQAQIVSAGSACGSFREGPPGNFVAIVSFFPKRAGCLTSDNDFRLKLTNWPQKSEFALTALTWKMNWINVISKLEKHLEIVDIKHQLN